MSSTSAALSGAFSDASASDLLELVRWAETAERYEDMCYFSRCLVEKRSAAKEKIETEERNLLSVAYKNLVGSKRGAWRVLTPESEDEAEVELLSRYRKVVEKEVNDVCREVLALIDEHLIPLVKGGGDEAEVFFLKMGGDYYRYLCEIDQSEENVQSANKYYQSAWEVAEKVLTSVHPTRLGLALNFSVCKYEVLKDSKAACKMAKEAFDQAIDKLDDIEDASYKDATLIMQLLRDNLTLWTSEDADE
jgi:hypothetical protein